MNQGLTWPSRLDSDEEQDLWKRTAPIAAPVGEGVVQERMEALGGSKVGKLLNVERKRKTKEGTKTRIWGRRS